MEAMDFDVDEVILYDAGLRAFVAMVGPDMASTVAARPSNDVAAAALAMAAWGRTLDETSRLLGCSSAEIVAALRVKTPPVGWRP